MLAGLLRRRKAPAADAHRASSPVVLDRNRGGVKRRSPQPAQSPRSPLRPRHTNYASSSEDDSVDEDGIHHVLKRVRRASSSRPAPPRPAPPQPKPAPKPKPAADENEPLACCICLEDIEKLRSTVQCQNCSQYTHGQCLRKWFERSGKRVVGTTCPFCRAHIDWDAAVLATRRKLRARRR